ncbi:MAG: hypothetical protein F4Z01_05575 [Gammaproteobacteria bacterium]|nr:hypothetical protein [Gammaproteobacteria bacterium]
MRAIRPTSIGLDGKGPFSNSELEIARKNCLKIVDKVLALNSKQKKLMVSIREVFSYSDLPSTVTLEGCLEPSSVLRERIAKLSLTDFEAFVNTIYSLPTILPPIYVGVTTKQSIQTRYYQHRRNFDKRVEGTFGGRFKDTGFQWSDLVFSYVPQVSHELGSEALEALEDYIQYFSRPILGRI